MVKKKELTPKEIKGWVKVIRKDNLKEWKLSEELMKFSYELDVKRYELSGSTGHPVSIPYCSSIE